MVSEQATLAGGCFWCLEAVFVELRGVSSVVSGYAGGGDVAPTYELVCTGRTKYAEAVQVTFDPPTIDYRTLLEVFFALHDPTTLNRQGHDTGPQYRSAIFTHDAGQAQTAAAVIAALTADRVFPQPIVTQVQPLDKFHPAEAYHQNYYALHPQQGYCQAVISPKVAKLRQKFVPLLR